IKKYTVIREIPTKIGWKCGENKLAGFRIGINIMNKIPKAAISVKQLVKRLPSRCIKILALRNNPNIKATTPKGIRTISAKVGKNIM
ncbi:hypothetical protein, partial [Pseudomonas aeruginosa]|uniref:hypothetical protein n=1 Tax=Pseudomonas aeruginosa TaxID=287 RepID=UPI001E2AAB4E